MYDEGVVIGKVIGRAQAGPKSEYLLVQDRSNQQYPNTVAAELYGEKNRALFGKVGMGDLCRLVGTIRSYKSEQSGRWWTTFSVFAVTNLEDKPGGRVIQGGTDRGAAEGATPKVVMRDRVPGEDDNLGNPF